MSSRRAHAARGKPGWTESRWRRKRLLLTQFLSSAINDRNDEYGGSLENRARFALQIVGAIRAQVGRDFYVGFKISVDECMNEVLPWLRRGNTPADSVQICRWLEEAGVDALHITRRSGVPPPAQPSRHDAGRGTRQHVRHHGRERQVHVSQLCRVPYVALQKIFGWQWERPHRGAERRGDQPAGVAGRQEAVSIPVLSAEASRPRQSSPARSRAADCDGVTIARPSREPQPRRAWGRGTTGRRDRARTATSASSTSSRTRSAATTRAVSTRASRCARSSCRSTASPQCPMTHGRDLHAAPVPEPRGQEPDPPLEHRRAARRLRRRRHADAHQLGAEVRPRRSRSDRLVVDRGRRARQDRPRLRRHRDATSASRSGASSASACTSTTAATSSSSPTPAGSATSRRSPSARGSPPRASPTRCTASRPSARRGPIWRRSSARSRRPRGGRARRGSTGSRSTAPTATSSRSSSPRRSTTGRTSTAGRSRTARASCSRRCGRSAARSATTSTSR